MNIKMVPKNLIIMVLMILLGEISNVSTLFENAFIKAVAKKLKTVLAPTDQSQVFTTPSSLPINHSMPYIVDKRVQDIIKPNANYSIVCQGDQPLKWTIPEVKNKKTLTSFKTENVIPPNKEFRYGLRLDITNMSYQYVGFYNCHFNDTEDISEKNNENNTIYLYVDDEKHLAVNDISTVQVYTKIGDTFIMPCRPTSPYVNVTLQSYNVLQGPIQLNVPIDGYNTTFIYNPFYGISSDLTTGEIKISQYKCEFKRGRKGKIISLYVYTEPSIPDLPTPSVVDQNKGHTVVGGNISLMCQTSVTNRVTFSWTGPFDQKRMVLPDSTIHSSSLIIMNVTLNDMGVYTCNLADHQNHSSSSNITIKVFDKDEHFIIMNYVDYSNKRVGKAGDAYLELKAGVWGHPQTNFTWLRNVNDTIPLVDGQKYELSYTNNSNQTDEKTMTLKIKSLEVNDTGSYTLLGKNSYENKSIQFDVNITGKPSVSLRSDNFHLLGEEGKVQCIAEGNPSPDISWKYKSCSRPECKYSFVGGKVKEHKGIKVISEIRINATESGFVKCMAKNTEGFDEAVTGYQVTDVPGGFSITGFADTAIVGTESKTAIYAMGENISIKCLAALSNYSQITWLLDDNVIQETRRITLKPTRTKYSNGTTLTIDNSNKDDSGEYACRVLTSNGKEEIRSINLLIKDPSKVEIVETNMKDEEMVVDFHNPVKMVCMANGLPKPSMIWYKNDVILEPNEPRISFKESRQILVFNETVVEDAGTYKCKAVYKSDFDEREVKLKFKNVRGSQIWLIYIIVLLLVALVASMIYLIVRVKKERKLKRELQLLGLANFEKGAVDNMNPELGIDDQAELLPYDKKWEFPIEQLKLGKQLGSGAFGVVLKGEAKHIIEGEPITTVAVKMVKKNADSTYLKALASELKIMVHLGKHLNVVNLLGACTKNVAKRELLVIVEYCRYGNLQNYLLKHRDYYVNQIDPQTEKINFSIGQELLDRTYSVSSNKSNINSPLMKYASLAFADSTNSFNMSSPNDMGDYRAYPNTQNTEVYTLSQGDDSVILSNNSTQPEWRSNYKGDYRGNVKPISTKDLIAYAFQIARGMEYLASRKVLHGDLAARNILLSEDNIVKICDFGLAKSMYKNESYRKRGDCPLPVKWMAIESIRDRVFSTQSDCWSYGIVMWELFSLGRTPYPGMQADETFYNKLAEEGYRLERPEFCPKEMYQIMRECWSVKPASRPSFTKLTERVGTLLEDTVRKHYIDLNDPYLMINTKMLEGHSDYLSMLSPPNFDVIVSPDYVNDVFTQSPPPDDGYMSMKSNTIFSPRVTDDEVFNFNLRNRKNCPSVEVEGHELSPMLRAISEADSEASLGSPNGVSNPSYHRPPTITASNPSEILKSADNYVNMPQNKKCLLKDSKLGLIIDDKKEKYHYVNENNQDWCNIEV